MINPMSLVSKYILVTGASSGIGRETALYLASLGADVILAARDEEALNKVLQEMDTGNHKVYTLDLTDNKAVAEMFSMLTKNGRRLDGIVHSAGISVTKPVRFLTNEDYYNVMNINFFSFAGLVRQFADRSRNNHGGSIVAISSISSAVGARGLSAYCASKGALESSIRSMALDLAPRNIRINAVSPAVVETTMYQDLKKIANKSCLEEDLLKRQVLGLLKPYDVAAAAAFLLSDAARRITGTTIIVDAGYLSQ